MEEKKEAPWTIKSWEEFRSALASMNPRSKMYRTIREEMKKRGNWKNAPRGSYKKKSLQ